MGSGQVGWPPGTGLGECVSSPVAPSYPPRHCCISSARGTVGAHHPSAEGKHLSVSTPHPQQVPVFPDAGTISLATPLMTRGRRLGLSVSKFMCLKKKKITFRFLVQEPFLFSVLLHNRQDGWLGKWSFLPGSEWPRSRR